MFTFKHPSKIIFGENSAKDFHLPENSLVITSKGAKSRGWIDYIGLNDSYFFDQVEPNPSIETAMKIISEFEGKNFSYIIGIGGGSSLDVAKFVAQKMKKSKIMIPTTFGSGSEVTRIAVLKVNGKKQSFHNDNLFADVVIVDPFFINNTPDVIIKNSAVDACAQCTEGFDSTNGNALTKFLCEKAFDTLEYAILNDEYERLPFGSLLSGLGFGNSSTTLGHALSYVFSNEGIPHGHALAFTTLVAHKFNNSIFYERFFRIVKKLNFQPIKLKKKFDDAAELILTDRKHLDNNPKNVTKQDLVLLIKIINENKSFENL